jgi:hypothetical protein
MHLALTGSPGNACEALGKRRGGIDKWAPKLSVRPGARRRARAGAQARRIAADDAGAAGLKLPFVDHRRKRSPRPGPLPRVGEGGQVLNEFGEWEDGSSIHRPRLAARQHQPQAAQRPPSLPAGDQRVRGNRAAFEILTGCRLTGTGPNDSSPRPMSPGAGPALGRATSWWPPKTAGWPTTSTGRTTRPRCGARSDAYRLPPVSWSEGSDD